MTVIMCMSMSVAMSEAVESALMIMDVIMTVMVAVFMAVIIAVIIAVFMAVIMAMLTCVHAQDVLTSMALCKRVRQNMEEHISEQPPRSEAKQQRLHLSTSFTIW